jgi:hypothetical protein
MAVKTGSTVTLENVDIFYLNFEGKEGQYNKEGDRNFALGLTEDVAAEMMADGWNVKRTKVREEELAEDPDAVGRPWLPIAVEFRKGKPPKVVMITSRGKTVLHEDTIALLDSADIQNADVIFAASNWEVNGNTGVKAYLRTLFVTIEEDELERKYADLDNQ